MKAILLLSLIPIYFIFAHEPYQGKIGRGQPKVTEDIKKLSTPKDAVKLAESITLNSIEALFTRYIWIQKDKDFEIFKAMVLANNYISKSPIPYRPIPLEKGALIQVDLRLLAPSHLDIVDFINTWEELRFDPTFNKLITPDTVKAISEKVKINWRLVDCPEYIGPNEQGKMVKLKQKWVYDWAEQKKQVNTVRVIPAHVDTSRLRVLTNSEAPIVEYKYFLSRALSAIKDKGIYKEIFGGLYYDFMGFKNKKKKGTDEDRFFELLGAADIDKGVKATDIFDSIPSDQRVALFRSDITGRPRRVDWFKTRAGRDNQGVVFITHDLKEGDIEIGQSPIANLEDFQDAAREVIAEWMNGLHRFALFNNKGELQEEAPADVATDHTIPVPYRPRLQPAIGCIRCHGSNNKLSGWQPLRNDVKKILSGQLSTFEKDLEKVTRLKAWYSGSPDKTLSRARDDYEEGILRIIGPWKDGGDQTDISFKTSQKIASIYQEYWYTPITPQMALMELGYEVPKEKALKFLRMLLPPVSEGGYFVQEDFRIAALKEDISINRSEWALVYAFAAARAQKTLMGR